MVRCDRQQPSDVGCKLDPPDCFERSSNGARHVGKSQSYGFRTKIDANEARARGKKQRKIGDHLDRRTQSGIFGTRLNLCHLPLTLVTARFRPYIAAVELSRARGIQIPTTLGMSMRITWYSHSCFRIETGAAVLLVDPFLKGNPAFEASGVAWAQATAGVTHVALTHGHDDHIGDAAEICTANSATLIAVYELAAHVKGKSAIKIEPMNTGGTVAPPEFALTMTPALHSSSSNGVYLGNPCGIVVHPTAASDRSKMVYHMGDTDIFAGMALIDELHQPAIGIVPIGDRFTMGAKTAAFACKKFFHFKTVIPCHYGTFPGMLDPDASAFVSHMSGKNVIVPAIGTAIEL